MMPDNRAAARLLYDGLCDVIIHKKVRDEQTKLTKWQEQPVYTGLSCHVSFDDAVPVEHTSAGASAVSKKVTLFCDPEPVIPAGSKLVMTQCGRTETYQSSGEANVYIDHQEVSLKDFVEWA